MAKENKYKLIVIAEIIMLAAALFIYFTYKLPAIIYYASSSTPQMQSKDKIIRSLLFDRIRSEDTTNILLALQDFISEREMIPPNLQVLKDGDYSEISQNFHDPETSQPYYFKPLKDHFVFCVNMSDRVKGVNVKSCPPKQTAQVSDYSVYDSGFRWLFTVFWTVALLVYIFLILYLIKNFLIKD